MIIEISTAEFLSFIGRNFTEIPSISYRELHEIANKIEHRVKGIRINVSVTGLHRVVNIYGLEIKENRIEMHTLSFKRMLDNERIPRDITSRLIKILKDK